MKNLKRAEKLVKKYGFDFEKIPKSEITDLLETEIENYQEGSSEYIRLLCGYLFCIGDKTDIPLIEKAKYSINMDVGCMVDWEWLESLKNEGKETEYCWSRKKLIEIFIEYYTNFKADEWDE
ncbi:MAG: hypothetical protein NC205_02665 [Prevotella sp.]|nr:hypothetical protein [Alistipes senegalensis]MCM1357471.1 hypothetical protein [Prevotella sp.]MCM1473017.1 hypothetical protein [Muribaculaceae bacterium]